jgi:hypothetical protein
MLGAHAIADEDDAEPATWSADPTEPGPARPPAGRSAFDREFTTVSGGRRVYDIPFPFSALLEKLNARTGGNVRAVLIPLGRSLQRSAADPDYFESPRVVAAVVGDAPAGAQPPHATLKDRLFLGYQERADIIEVISYNDAAGRFEFQVVDDYRAGSAPRVSYAQRSTCVTCHQNHAPLFSRPLWDETNANPDVAARLALVQDSFHGVAARVGVDIPDAIDSATDRANRFSLYQRIWADGCGGSTSSSSARCRGDYLVAALRYGLAGQRHARAADTERAAMALTLAQHWPTVWPGGLAVANPDIPNRKLSLFEPGRGPLELDGALQRGVPLSKADTADVASVPLSLEPLNARAPLAVWRAEDIDAARLDEIVAGLASFVSPRDFADLDGLLASRRAARPARLRTAACVLTRGADTASSAGSARIRVACADEPSGMRLDASLTLGDAPAEDGTIGSGRLHRLVLSDADRIRGLGLSVSREGGDAQPLRLRLGAGPGGLRDLSGNAIGRVTLRLNETANAAVLEVEIIEDFADIADAVGTLATRTTAGDSRALSALPFGKAAVFAELFELLGGAYEGGCCDTPMPEPVVQGASPE